MQTTSNCEICNLGIPADTNPEIPVLGYPNHRILGLEFIEFKCIFLKFPHCGAQYLWYWGMGAWGGGGSAHTPRIGAYAEKFLGPPHPYFDFSRGNTPPYFDFCTGAGQTYFPKAYTGRIILKVLSKLT